MSNPKGKLIIKAKRTPCQHKTPCSDCPWAREALKGWLGALTPDEWIAIIHGEAIIDCHTQAPWQCAGAAIYRANVCKTPRYGVILQLEPDTGKVFATPEEFLKHHAQANVPVLQ